MQTPKLTPQELMERGVAFNMEEVGGILDEADVRRIRITLETIGNPLNLTQQELIAKLRVAGLIVWPKEIREYAVKTGYTFRDSSPTAS